MTLPIPNNHLRLKPVADLNHMKIEPMNIAPIEVRIGHMVKPITYAKPPIDLGSHRCVPHKLEQTAYVLIWEAVPAKERGSPSDFQREPAVFLLEYNPGNHSADECGIPRCSHGADRPHESCTDSPS